MGSAKVRQSVRPIRSRTLCCGSAPHFLPDDDPFPDLEPFLRSSTNVLSTSKYLSNSPPLFLPPPLPLPLPLALLRPPFPPLPDFEPPFPPLLPLLLGMISIFQANRKLFVVGMTREPVGFVGTGCQVLYLDGRWRNGELWSCRDGERLRVAAVTV